MFGLGAGEIFVIAVLALIFIGPKKLPELARGLGRGIREFQKAKNELMDEVNRSQEDHDDDQVHHAETEKVEHKEAEACEKEETDKKQGPTNKPS